MCICCGTCSAGMCVFAFFQIFCVGGVYMVCLVCVCVAVYVASTWCVYVQCVCGVRLVCVLCGTCSAGMYVFTSL